MGEIVLLPRNGDQQASCDCPALRAEVAELRGLLSELLQQAYEFGREDGRIEAFEGSPGRLAQVIDLARRKSYLASSKLRGLGAVIATMGAAHYI